MKILYIDTGKRVGDNGEGGSQRSLLQLVQRLDNNEYDVYTLFYEDFNIIKEFRDIGCIVYVKKLNNYILNNDFNFLNSKSLPKVIRACNIGIILILKICFILYLILYNKIDVVHCNNRISTSLEGLIASFITRRKCIQHQRDYNTNIPKIYNFFKRRVFKYIAISDDIKKNLTGQLEIPAEEVIQIDNWLNINKNEKSIENIISSENDNQLCLKLLWVGRIVEWKGTIILVGLAKKLKEKNLFFSIDIVGEPHLKNSSYYKLLKAEIKNNNLTENFNLVGFKKSSEIFRTKYDMLIHTSIRPEPFGRVIIEGMYNNVPVLATNLGGPKDIISNGENGFLYDPTDIQSLFEIVILLSENQLLKKRIIKQAYIDFENKYSGQKQMQLIENLYKETKK
jgi:glycosyltransferase involved in cell wall biosynthesis